MHPKFKSTLAYCCLLLFIGATPLLGQAQPDSQRPSIEDFAWIAGNWQGKAMGGQFEETWNAPSGGAMMGMFKFVENDKIGFYELLAIVPKDESIVLRLKHFDSQLAGWEEKNDSVEFPLISVTKTVAKFDGLAFTLLNPDRMDIVVVTQTGDKSQELKFECHRVKPAAKSKLVPAATSASSSAAQAINRVIEIDKTIAKQRDLLPETHSLSFAVQAYVVGLKAIDMRDCPAEFVDAFSAHRNAWADSVAFFKKHPKPRGEMHNAIAEIRKLGPETVAELDATMSPIMNTWKAIESAIKKSKMSENSSAR